MTNQSENIFSEDNLDFRKYLFLVLRNWYWFAISIFVSLFGAYYINRFTEPIYSVSSSVIVRNDQQRGSLTGVEQMLEGMEIFRTNKAVENELEILKSYTLSRMAIAELKDFEINYVAIGRFKNARIYNQAEFLVIPDSGHIQPANYPVFVTMVSDKEYRLQINEGKDISRLMKFGESFRESGFSFSIVLRNPEEYVRNGRQFIHEKYFFHFNSLHSLTNEYRSKLNVSINDPKKGSVVTLSLQGLNARQETDYLNKLMEVYLRRGLNEKNEIASKALEFIDEQLGFITDSLRRSESALQEFRLSNQIMDIGRESSAIFEKFEALQREKAELELHTNYFNYLFTYLEGKTAESNLVAPSLVGIGDPLLNSLVEQLNNLIFEKRMAEFTARENNPGILLLNNKIQSVTSALLENVRNLKENNRMAVGNINRRLLQVETELQKLPATERKLIDIQRQFNFNDYLYTYLLQKKAEAGIARASNVADNAILDQALYENALLVSPKRSLNYVIALFLGFGLPLLLLLVTDLLNTKIREKQDVENKTNVPILGTIGHNPVESEFPVYEKPRSSMAESFRALRTSLQYMLQEPGAKTISVTSTVTGEGKTFTAINLATVIAISGKKTLLVGLDLRKPKINRVFKLDKNTGLSTYLIGQSHLDEIHFPTFVENLSVVSAGPVPPNPAELLQSPAMEKFVDWAKENFEYIVFDTPPVAVVTDALIMSRFCNFTLFVIRQNFSEKRVVELINELHKRGDFKKIAIVVNDIKSPGYYGYDYGYRYGYGYGYGYGEGYYSDEPKSRGFFYRLRNLFG